MKVVCYEFQLHCIDHPYFKLNMFYRIALLTQAGVYIFCPFALLIFPNKRDLNEPPFCARLFQVVHLSCSVKFCNWNFLFVAWSLTETNQEGTVVSQHWSNMKRVCRWCSSSTPASTRSRCSTTRRPAAAAAGEGSASLPSRRSSGRRWSTTAR